MRTTFNVLASALILSMSLSPLMAAEPNDNGTVPDDSEEMAGAIIAPPGGHTAWTKIADDKSMILGTATAKYTFRTKTFTQANCPKDFVLVDPDGDGKNVQTVKLDPLKGVFTPKDTPDLISKEVKVYAVAKNVVMDLTRIAAAEMVTDKTNPAKHVYGLRRAEWSVVSITKKYTTTTTTDDTYAVFPDDATIVGWKPESLVTKTIAICEQKFVVEPGGGGASLPSSSSSSSALSSSSASSSLSFSSPPFTSSAGF